MKNRLLFLLIAVSCSLAASQLNIENKVPFKILNKKNQSSRLEPRISLHYNQAADLQNNGSTRSEIQTVREFLQAAQQDSQEWNLRDNVQTAVQLNHGGIIRKPVHNKKKNCSRLFSCFYRGKVSVRTDEE